MSRRRGGEVGVIEMLMGKAEITAGALLLATRL